MPSRIKSESEFRPRVGDIHYGLRLLLAVAGIQAGCSPTSVEGNRVVRVVTEQSIYSGGDTLTATVRNVSSYTVGYMPCPLLLERKFDGVWEEYGSRAGFVSEPCDLIVVRIDPENFKELRVALPRNLAGGQYRIRVEHLVGNDGATRLPLESRVSNEFTVQ
jgi:hypothetical protein